MSNGVRFVGKDPDGIAKAISVNDDGVLLVELLGSLLVGEVAENPTANTILGRMKSLESKIDTFIGYVDGVEAVLANILAKIIASPATEAKQDALNVLIGEVQANPTANTLLARLKAIEDKLTAGISLSGSKASEYEAITVDNTVGGKACATAKVGTCTKAFITVETAQIRFTIDGTAPTTTVGHLLNIGDILELDSAEDIAAFRAIRTGTASATIHCTYSA